MSESLFPAILLFGAPGVGKGTQGKLLGQIDGFYHLSSGDMFRALDLESSEGQEVQQYSSRGELVPDDLTIRIWRNWLDNLIADTIFDPQSEMLLLDGIPRNVKQCEILRHHVEVRKVVHLASQDDEPIIARIKKRAVDEGRDDDAKDEVVRRRFQIYRDETTPVLNYYASDITTEVDPMCTPAEVHKRIREHVVPDLKRFRGEDVKAD